MQGFLVLPSLVVFRMALQHSSTSGYTVLVVKTMSFKGCLQKAQKLGLLDSPGTEY